MIRKHIIRVRLSVYFRYFNFETRYEIYRQTRRTDIDQYSNFLKFDSRWGGGWRKSVAKRMQILRYSEWSQIFFLVVKVTPEMMKNKIFDVSLFGVGHKIFFFLNIGNLHIFSPKYPKSECVEYFYWPKKVFSVKIMELVGGWLLRFQKLFHVKYHRAETSHILRYCVKNVENFYKP